jgi:hypothetical protein
MKLLTDAARETGVELEQREGAKHTRVTIGDRRSVIPRHTEINETTAKAILKQMGVER